MTICRALNCNKLTNGECFYCVQHFSEYTTSRITYKYLTREVIKKDIMGMKIKEDTEEFYKEHLRYTLPKMEECAKARRAHLEKFFSKTSDKKHYVIIHILEKVVEYYTPLYQKWRKILSERREQKATPPVQKEQKEYIVPIRTQSDIARINKQKEERRKATKEREERERIQKRIREKNKKTEKQVVSCRPKVDNTKAQRTKTIQELMRKVVSLRTMPYSFRMSIGTDIVDVMTASTGYWQFLINNKLTRTRISQRLRSFVIHILYKFEYEYSLMRETLEEEGDVDIPSREVYRIVYIMMAENLIIQEISRIAELNLEVTYDSLIKERVASSKTITKINNFSELIYREYVGGVSDDLDNLALALIVECRKIFGDLKYITAFVQSMMSRLVHKVIKHPTADDRCKCTTYYLEDDHISVDHCAIEDILYPKLGVSVADIIVDYHVPSPLTPYEVKEN